jgi:hypothetical protein
MGLINNIQEIINRSKCPHWKPLPFLLKLYGIYSIIFPKLYKWENDRMDRLRKLIK